MEYLLTAEEMSEADQYTSETIGIPSLVLMERAALGVERAVRADFPEPGPHARIAVVAGKGNNGADALAAGRILLDAGYDVRFFLLGEHPQGSLAVQIGILRQYHADLQPFAAADFGNYRPDAIIDGLFGTGLSRDVREPYRSAIDAVNAVRTDAGARIYSVDIPSGIDGTTGEVRGAAVHADVTVTFAFYKRGHFLYPGCEYCGRVIREEIGITQRSFPALSGEKSSCRRAGHEETAVRAASGGKEENLGDIFPELFTYLEETPEDILPARDPSGNKGTFGKILVIAGSKGVSGACTMCASAALRMGAGMVKVFTHEANRVILQETVPEAMVSTYPDMEKAAAGQSCVGETGGVSGSDPEVWPFAKRQLSEDIRWCSVIAIGPGIGRNAESLLILRYVLSHAGGKKLVIDADAVRLIAENDLYENLRRAGENGTVVLTPHMAECAALLQLPVADLKKRRFTEIKKFAKLYKCTIIGKDARSLAASWETEQQYLNTSGNDGLSTAGSGDVLTGMTAGCLAQGMSGFAGACAAAYLHGRLADRLAEKMSKRSITAGDLIRELSIVR